MQLKTYWTPNYLSKRISLLLGLLIILPTFNLHSIDTIHAPTKIHSEKIKDSLKNAVKKITDYCLLHKKKFLAGAVIATVLLRHFGKKFLFERNLLHLEINTSENNPPPFSAPVIIIHGVSDPFADRPNNPELQHRLDLLKNNGNTYCLEWSGILSTKHREEAAQFLYKELKRLDLKAPIIIGHSHGGNVALYLENAYRNDPAPSTQKPKVAQLITIATPIQRFTESYASNFGLFGKIFHLYSTDDTTQVIDPQGLQRDSRHSIFPFPLFSNRYFCRPNDDRFKQAAVKVDGKPFEHNDFWKQEFRNLLPSMIQKLTEQKTV
jgi:pimeloyl-ACP methyl ester carboxylesterase